MLAALFVAAGALHFLMPAFYLRIVPPQLPYPRALVYISGAAEVLGGVGVLVPAVRRGAGWGLIALLVAVFPANVHMAVEGVRAQGGSLYTAALLLRLPLQFVLIAWVWWCAVRGEWGKGRASERETGGEV